MRNIYTDLADEARELSAQSDGVREEAEEKDGIRISRIHIESEAAAKTIGKACGRYVTLDAPGLAERPLDLFARVSETLSRELCALFPPLPEEAPVLVVGLGNRSVTPDALGPRTVEQIYVTRHVRAFIPDAFSEPIPAVCAVAPGVLGVTGIETMEMVRGVVEHVRPRLILAVDSLASRRAGRICTAIQMTDTGICPGSGVGNARAGLNGETFQVPVIALGVPMVVYASTILRDALTTLCTEAGMEMGEERLDALAREAAKRSLAPMIVTPKDIDAIVNDTARILADGVNMALFGASYAQVRALLA